VKRISSIKFYKIFYYCLEKSIFCHEMSNIVINDKVDVDLLREFLSMERLLAKNISFAINFSIKDRTSLLTSSKFANSRLYDYLFETIEVWIEVVSMEQSLLDSVIISNLFASTFVFQELYFATKFLTFAISWSRLTIYSIEYVEDSNNWALWVILLIELRTIIERKRSSTILVTIISASIEE